MRDITLEKRTVQAHLEALVAGAAALDVFAPDAHAEVSYPWGSRVGAADVASVFDDIRAAMPDMEWRPEILIGGENHPDTRAAFARVSPLVGTWGHLQGTFAAPLFGIPTTGRTAHLRMAQVHHLDASGRIAQSWIMPDLLDLMDQAGLWPLPPMAGAHGMWPGPKGGQGVRLNATDPVAGAVAMDRVLDMHNALNTHLGADVSTLGMSEWADPFMYYASAGIGMCRGTEGFRAHHQVPFRVAFADRHSRGHFVRIGDGDFALTGGRLYATQTGPYLGHAATRRQVHLDVMDFYRFDADGLIAENWLPFDILGLMHQIGADLLPEPPEGARMPR